MILAGAAVAFVAGVVLGSAFGAPGWLLLSLAVALGASAWFLRRTRAWVLAVLAAALCLGFWRVPHVGSATPGELRYYNGRIVQVTGTVSAEPDIRDTGANYQIAIDTLQAGTRARTVSGGLYVHTSSAVHLEYGDRISMQGLLRGTGTSGFSASLARQGIYSEMRFPKLTDLGPSTSVSWFSSAISRLRQRLEAGIDAWLPEPEAALLIAITLGARSSELGDLAPILVTTGLIHLIAISGIKVALVAGMIQQAIRSFAGRLLSLLGATGALWLYVLLTGFTPSGVRSAGMWTLVFIAGALGRKTMAVLSLTLVAAVMVALDPSLPWDIGFELSVVGTLAIVALADPVDGAISSFHLPSHVFGREMPAWLTSISLPPSPFREALSVTIAAQAGTVPIVILGFHLLSGSGPISNTVALPFLPLLIVVGFLLGALSGVAGVAAPLSGFAYVLLHLIVSAARDIASFGGAPALKPFGPPAVIVYYAALAAAAGLVFRRTGWVSMIPSRGQGRELALAGVVGASLLSVSVFTAQARPATTLSWLGTGNALLLQSNGMSALVDGSNHPFTLLERLGSLLPHDMHAIDLIVVTDPRSSSVSGLEAVLQHYRIGEVMDVGAEYPTTTYARWRAELRAAHVPVYALRTGASVALGGARLTVLGPDALYPKPQDSAGMLRIVLAREVFLLATAADVREQHEAVFRGITLHAGTLLIGAKWDDAFVRAVHPGSVVYARRLPSAGTTLYP